MRALPDLAPLVKLVGSGTIDVELAALLWLLVEGRTPVVVGSDDRASRETFRDALIPLCPPDATLRRLAGPRETFAWMPEAAGLGWHPGAIDAHEGPAGDHRSPVSGSDAKSGISGARTGGGVTGRSLPGAVLIADLSPDGPEPTWGERARIVIRALALGYAMLATSPGSRLEHILDRLAAPPVNAIEDELAGLGTVVLLGPDTEGIQRVAAAHYLRPVARDAHGHIQRRPPAVLATWAPADRRFEHFAWGVADDLAGRIGTTPAELEREQDRRAQQIGQLAAVAGLGQP